MEELITELYTQYGDKRILKVYEKYRQLNEETEALNVAHAGVCNEVISLRHYLKLNNKEE